MGVDIDWGLLKTPNFVNDGLNAFVAGQQLGRQVATQQALQNFNSDPNGATNALIRAGNIQGASELAGLQYQQQQRGLLGAVQQRIAQRAAGGQGGAQPGANPQQAQVVKVLDAFDSAGTQLKGLPYEQRKAALAQMTPQLAQATGLPADQIASFDPTDDNIGQIHAQTAQAHQQFGTQPGPGASAAFLDPRDPTDNAVLGTLAIANPQMASSLLSVAEAGLPKYVPGRPGAPVFDERTGQFVAAAPNAQGVQLDIQGGKVVGAHGVPGYAEAAAGFESAVAGGKAHAEHAAAAPYQVEKYDLGNGQTVQLTLDQFKALKSSGLLPNLGKSITPGQEQFQKNDAEAFSKEIDAHGPTAVTSTQNARSVTEQAITMANAINPNAWTSKTGQIAGVINAATGGKIGAKEANNIATYSALMPQVLRGTFTTFPRLEKEFEIVQKAAANVNTPQDAAKILLGTQAAIQGRNLAYAQWLANNYQGPPSKQAMTKAWLQTPQSQSSIFADPIWRNMTIGGKPAVMIGDKPLQDGHVYGVFRPGTSYAQTFVVR